MKIIKIISHNFNLKIYFGREKVEKKVFMPEL